MDRLARQVAGAGIRRAPPVLVILGGLLLAVIAIRLL
jgi:hypothetical protein